MMKRKWLALLMILALLLLTACTTSAQINGTWVGHEDGMRIEVTFSDGMMTWRVIEADGSVTTSLSEYTLTRGVMRTKSGKYNYDRVCYVSGDTLVLGGMRLKKGE